MAAIVLENVKCGENVEGRERKYLHNLLQILLFGLKLANEVIL